MIAAVTLVYNAESLLGYAIEAVLPFVDEYIIVNGSPYGPSTDLTKAVIDSFDSPKIKYFEGTFGSREAEDNWDIVQHNFAFEQCTCDWIWKVDADEIYDPLQIQKIPKLCRLLQDYYYFQWINLYFVRDTTHIRYVPPPIRLWRNLEGNRFIDISVTPTYHGIPIFERWKGCWLQDVQTFHYGFILPYRHQFARIQKFIDREDNEDAKARPLVYINAHLRDAWGDVQLLRSFQRHPKAIRQSLFYNRGVNLEGKRFGILTTGKYDSREDVGGSELSLCLAREALQRKGVLVEAGPSLKSHYHVGLVFREVVPPEVIDADIKVWWSCDQYPDQDIAPIVKDYDLILAISDFHKRYLVEQCHLPQEKVKVTNLGIDPEEYQELPPKVKGQIIYCSQPDRGLRYLADIFARIKQEVPYASLVITCDKTLWGLEDPGNAEERKLLESLEGVTFLGKVPRSQLLELQKTSEIMLFPCIYEELFCLAALECQAAGCAVITHAIGALPETVVNGYTGLLLPEHPSTPAFQEAAAQRVIQWMGEAREELELFQRQGRKRAFQFFTWDDIIYEWTFYLDIFRRLKKLDW